MEQRAKDNKTIELLLESVERYHGVLDTLLRVLNFDVSEQALLDERYGYPGQHNFDENTRNDIVKCVKQTLEPEGPKFATSEEIENTFKLIWKDLKLLSYNDMREIRHKFEHE